MKRTSLETNIWKMYLVFILRRLDFFLPVIVLFWMDNGLSLTEIMVLQSLFSFALIALEIPSGYFADIFGRKLSIIFGCIAFSLGIIVYSLGFGFLDFLVAELLLAVSIAFLSGADSALLYDSLKGLKREKEYTKLMGKMDYYGYLALVVASIAGGFMGEISLRLPFTLMIPATLLMVLVSFTLIEPKRHKLIFKRGYLSDMFNVLHTYLIKNKRVKWLVIYIAAVGAFNQAGLWLFQPYFVLTGVGIAYFGLIFAAFNVVAGLSAKYAYKIEAFVGRRKSLASLMVITVLAYLLLGSVLFFFSFLFIFLLQFVRGFTRPVVSDYINRATPSSVRATVLSGQALSRSVLYALIIPFVGVFADVYSVDVAFTIIGVTALVTGLLLLFLMKRAKII